MARVYLKTFGCKVNLSDSHTMLSRFEDHGFLPTDIPSEADITILNTCSVTSRAERDARALARKLKRENPQTHMVLAGCYAQTHSANLLEMDDVDFVLPNEKKHEAAHYILESMQNGLRFPLDLKTVSANKQGHFKTAHTLFGNIKPETSRAFLKIQDGCNGFCTYCLIPYARGASRSVPLLEVIQEIKSLVAKNFAEVVLTGIHVGDYGEDLGSSFAELLDQICTQTDIHRLRISSLEPSEVNTALLMSLEKHKDRICDHFHLPLQSGSNRILKLMRRSYTVEQYRDNIAALRSIFPNAHFAADVMVGFPGETAEDFAASVDAVRAIGLNSLHVFSYSSRPNTAAARFSGHIDAKVISSRSKELRHISMQLHSAYMQSQIGQSVEALWQKDGYGLTRNYLKVKLKGAASPPTYEQGSCGVVKLLGRVDSNKMLASVVA